MTANKTRLAGIPNARTALLGISLVTLGACSLGPDYSRPDINLPPSFREPSDPAGQTAKIPWRELFRDPQLAALIESALAENKDLQAAAARIAESRAILGITRADQFPSLDLSGGASRTDSSKELAGESIAPRNQFDISTQLSFELDLWGRLSRATEAQRAELLGSEYSQRSIQISLISQVAANYFLLVDLDTRLAVSGRTLQNRQDATKNIQQQFRAGVVGELDFRQAEIEQADVETQVASLERQLRTAENSMAVLLGRPSAPVPRIDSLDKEILLDFLPAGLPQSLIENRPDVLAAEAALAAETARIGVAQAERLPSLNLNGFFGLQSRDFENISDGRTWGFGADLAGPLLNYRRNLSNVELYEARTDEALKNYEQSILKAVQEVEDALIAIRTYKAEHQSRVRQRDSAAAAARLSRDRYTGGLSPYLEVLDTERSLFAAELAVSQTSERYLNSIVTLYKALGGGWAVN